MAKINYDVNTQIQALANQIATSEVEKARLSAIVSGASEQIEELMKKNAQLEAKLIAPKESKAKNQ
ncbi:hypothetical protein [Sporolactobacillus terrae]|uniref:hypothetical protein n=1 Tax=Sporolactobacillus terrae TaxID=269673 RepID=UPI00048C9E06|nr:hypothetical protein [Sporolactobacillus terrae]